MTLAEAGDELLIVGGVRPGNARLHRQHGKQRSAAFIHSQRLIQRLCAAHASRSEGRIAYLCRQLWIATTGQGRGRGRGIEALCHGVEAGAGRQPLERCLRGGACRTGALFLAYFGVNVGADLSERPHFGSMVLEHFNDDQTIVAKRHRTADALIFQHGITEDDAA